MVVANELAGARGSLAAMQHRFDAAVRNRPAHSAAQRSSPPAAELTATLHERIPAVLGRVAAFLGSTDA